MSLFIRQGMSILLGFTLLAVAGCGSKPTKSQGETPAISQQASGSSDQLSASGGASAKPTDWGPAEIAYDYAAMQDDVLIQLKEEPRLHSPLRTVVGVNPQTYTFFFREVMDRGSVESAIRKHAKEESTREDEGFINPDLSFHWLHDRQLQLLVTLPEKSGEEPVWQEYVLNAGGARTAKGSLIGDNFSFQALVLPPQQIWRIAADGKITEKLTDFSVMTNLELLDPEQRYAMLTRFTNYCECDALYDKLYSIYDSKTQTVTSYPIELSSMYRGAGDFMADRRGFFYAQPNNGTDVPKSEFASRILVDGYVHGVSFSRDRKHLLMAVGEAEQKKDLDLVVLDLTVGTEKHYPGVIKGWVPTSEWDGAVVPVSFADDGRFVTFAMRKEEKSFEEARQRFDWKTGKVTSWNPPVPADFWSGFIQTDDGAYQYYWNAGLYQGGVQLLQQAGTGIWIPGTHRFVFAESAQESDGMELFVFDADRKQKTLLKAGLSYGFTLLGASSDGKWLYVATNQSRIP
ncbi:hypothetical protein BRE01_40810 [Brevibacillus reuszeri]|uniref:Lipoprotein n=1 Tax=Brevibacillus reuszeri TaxID=54915 RepID=A0ABQ0TRD5_9BACL|nr:hypothetical protein [Brevibacillus reuszeri]MED1860710.1 hypothetical protein [Brevibacillus reuszeri]GED70379.1 hypothetical protein BRE01_40810 [Brevibacillus reuszeri]